MGKLGIYLPANYPSRQLFIEAVRVCRECRVDFLEVGFAFSDPIADGGLLEKASHRVLMENTLDDLINGFAEARSIFQGKTYIMTYTNIVYHCGIGNFLGRVGPVSGLILADLPLRETPMFEKELDPSAVSLIRFVTPESRETDMDLALRGAHDFIYFVSKRGTTGGAFALEPETTEKIGSIRGKGVDVYLGFGIESKADFETACGRADGAIIGTKAVAELERGIKPFEAFLRSLRS